MKQVLGLMSKDDIIEAVAWLNVKQTTLMKQLLGQTSNNCPIEAVILPIE